MLVLVEITVLYVSNFGGPIIFKTVDVKYITMRRNVLLLAFFVILCTMIFCSGVVSAEHQYDNGNLTREEVDSVYNRTVDRTEMLTNYSYQERPSYTLVTRKEFRNSSRKDDLISTTEETRLVWNEALFITTDGKNYSEAASVVLSETVGGYYLSSSGEMVIIVERDETGYTINTITIAHELVHAQQDERYSLDNQSTDKTYDGQMAYRTIVEGEAVRAESQYIRKCFKKEWDCLQQPSPNINNSGFNDGILKYQLFPYIYGYSYTENRNTTYQLRNPPNETRQITRNTSEEVAASPKNFERPNTWLYTSDGPNVNRMGSALISSHIYYHSQKTEGFPIKTSSSTVQNPPPARQPSSYTHELSNDYMYDEFVPLKKQGEDTYGFIWTIQWDDKQSVRNYTRAYETIITKSGGEKTEINGKRFYRINETSGPSYYHVGFTDDNKTVILFSESKESIIDLEARTDNNQLTTVKRNIEEINLLKYIFVSILALFLLLVVAGDVIGQKILDRLQ